MDLVQISYTPVREEMKNIEDWKKQLWEEEEKHYIEARIYNKS